MKVVFTAMSKKRFYLRAHITKYVIDNDAIPINPFMCFNYFLLDTVSRDAIRRANSKLLSLCEELWVFGEISDGVLKEIWQAKKENKPIKYFKIVDEPLKFIEIDEEELIYEEDALKLLSDKSNED